MPATSDKQRKFMNVVAAAQAGAKGVTGAAKKAAKTMTKKSVHDFAHTKGELPEGQMEEANQDGSHLIQDLEFWVVEKAMRPSEAPTDLVFKSDPIHFAKQIMAGLDPANVLGFYLDEKEAMDIAHDQVEAVMEAAKSLEEKKHMTTSKIEETIKNLQKEVNRCMEEGMDERAQRVIQKIAELRSKHKMIEASKKPLEEKEK